MDAVQSGPLALALSFVLGVALAAGALFMWLSRQIAALKLRLQQVDHARLQGAQQL